MFGLVMGLYSFLPFFWARRVYCDLLLRLATLVLEHVLFPVSHVSKLLGQQNPLKVCALKVSGLDLGIDRGPNY